MLSTSRRTFVASSLLNTSVNDHCYQLKSSIL